MRIIIPTRTGAPIEQSAVDDYEAKSFPAVFDFLESVAPDAEAIVAGCFGIADIALAAPVRLLDLADAPLDAARWPRFASYYRRTMSRPSAISIVDAEVAATEVFRRTGNAPN